MLASQLVNVDTSPRRARVADVVTRSKGNVHHDENVKLGAIFHCLDSVDVAMDDVSGTLHKVPR